jgi:malate dehydrogenase
MKISIIGAGNVGASTALKLCEKELGDVVLVDVVEGVPQGKALDIQQAMPLNSSNSRITGSNDFSEIKNSDIVVCTAGLARKPGMTREDLVIANSNIIKSVAANIKKYAPKSIVIVVTNPLDVMTYLMMKETGFAKEKVIGMAGVLDSTRMRAFIAEELDVSVSKVSALVLGSHGDSMVPLAEHTLVEGKRIKQFMDDESTKKIVERTRNAGAEIVNHLKTGSAFYAPGASVVEMIDAMIKDDGRILPCSVYLGGEYGYKGIFLGVPVKFNSSGVKEIVDIRLSKEEKALLDKSAEIVKQGIKELR